MLTIPSAGVVVAQWGRFMQCWWEYKFTAMTLKKIWHYFTKLNIYIT